MVISRSSQLGLMMDDNDVRIEFLTLMKDGLEKREAAVSGYIEKLSSQIDKIGGMVDAVKSDGDGSILINKEEYEELLKEEAGSDLLLSYNNDEIRSKIHAIAKDKDFLLDIVSNENSKLYLICSGVDTCSKMVRIGDNFSSKALRNIKFGKHTYLLGKDEMTRFICKAGAIIGMYWNRKTNVGFEYGFDLSGDDYYFDERYSDEFNKIAKIITFVELGDIEVEILETGRNNGKSRNGGKITNTSQFTVYVVDSSWNKLIIRTEGFAVMGHFRLQPCGAGLVDRKLIWINAFEKHGYKRQPKASILNN